MELECDSGFHSRLKSVLANEKSSAAFARKAGLSQSGFNRIEKGGEPGLRALLSIARAAGVTVEWLASGQGPMRRDSAPAAPATPSPEPEDEGRHTVADRVQMLRGTTALDLFAREIGIDVKELQALEAGTGTDRKALEAIANGIGVRLDWLITGEGAAHMRQPRPTAVPDPPPQPVPTAGQPIDGRLLGLCFEGVRRTYRDANARIDDRSAGEMAGRLYAEVQVAAEGESDPHRAALRMALRQLHRELLAVPSASESGKHSA